MKICTKTKCIKKQLKAVVELDTLVTLNTTGEHPQGRHTFSFRDLGLGCTRRTSH